MKKSVCKVFTVCLVLMLLVSLCACSSGIETSAYDLAVRNGFKGSEQEYLDSLKGESAYDIAVKNGFVGTEKEWLNSLTTVTNNVENNYNVDLSNVQDVSVAANIGLKSVVSIYCIHTIEVTSFFGTQRGEVQSAGSGVIYKLDSDGSAYVITNHHVVYDYRSVESNKISKDIQLFLYGKENKDCAIKATYVGGSLNYDIAVLKVEANQLLKTALDNGTACQVQWADSDDIRVGQISIAIGNPEAEGISVTSGIISVESEYINMTAVDNRTKISLRVIRTDTAVNGGNSGGGLFNDEGKLIGIVNAKVDDSSVENIAYAIPCNVAKAIADNIIYYNETKGTHSVMRVILGVTVQTSEATTAVNPDNGFIEKTERSKVAELTDSSVVKDKLQVGDILVSLKIGDGKTLNITRQYQFIDALLNARVGDEITIGYIRNGETGSLTLTVPESCLGEY